MPGPFMDIDNYPSDPSALKAAFPFLVPVEDAGGKTGTTLAAINIRKWLKLHYPGVKFSVRLDRFSMGTSIDISWVGWQDNPGPEARELEASLKAFEPATFDGMTDSTVSDTHEGRRAFRRLFGYTNYIKASVERPTPLEEAERVRQALGKGLEEVKVAERQGKPRV